MLLPRGSPGTVRINGYGAADGTEKDAKDENGGGVDPSDVPAAKDAGVGEVKHGLPDKETCTTVLQKMMLIRRFEERAGEMYAKAKIGGFLHLCIGEEATVVGATQALRETDYLMSTYREHGQALARGTDATAVMAELFGREGGCSSGRGGSMHLFDWDKRFLGGYGIVGGSLPLVGRRRARLRLHGDRGRDPLHDGRRRHQPGHLRRDDEPRRAVEAAGRLRDHQQPVRDGHGAASPLGGHRPVAQVRGLRRARHALRRHGRARCAQRCDGVRSRARARSASRSWWRR